MSYALLFLCKEERLAHYDNEKYDNENGSELSAHAKANARRIQSEMSNGVDETYWSLCLVLPALDTIVRRRWMSLLVKSNSLPTLGVLGPSPHPDGRSSEVSLTFGSPRGPPDT